MDPQPSIYFSQMDPQPSIYFSQTPATQKLKENADFILSSHVMSQRPP